jgi:hypothetical protein
VKKKKKTPKKSRRKKIVSRKKSVFLRRAVKATGALAALLLLVYLSAAFLLDKGFLKRDLAEKYGQVLGTTTLTLRLIGPPNKPSVMAIPVCKNYLPYVELYWSSDDQMDYFDLERNGSPLVSGLTQAEYEDGAVEPLTSYDYAVTAFNPMGQNTSDPVTVTTLDCGTPPLPPPVLSATPICVDHIPHIRLTWTADDRSDHFDLKKDGDPLASGLTEKEYEDATVEALASYTYDVTAFSSDGQQSLSNSVSVTALDCSIPPLPPPVLSATPICVDHTPFINLAWTADDQMDHFDLKKDGDLLAGGLVKKEYQDKAIKVLSSYTYSVTGFNSIGQQGVSNSISATALDCSAEPPPPVLPDPTCVITKFQNINLANFHGTPGTEERMPKFYGTTNMPGAEIEIVISGKTSILATTSANANGFWMWKPQDKLNFGLNKIEATAIDPQDSTRKKTTSLDFRINHKEGEGGNEEEASGTKKTVPFVTETAAPSGQTPVETGPKTEGGVSLSVTVKNSDKIAYPGRNLSVETNIKPEKGAAPFQSEIKYLIVNENYDSVFETTDQVFVDGDKTIEKELAVPRLLKPGKYKVLVEISRNGTIVVAEDSFLLKEVPLLSLSGGITITATQIMSNLFWAILWLLILLIIFLTLLGIEYWISRHAIIQITEEILRKKGFVTRRKI